MDNHTFVAVGEYSITYGTFKIDPPIIRCHTNNPDMEGIVPAIVHTEAECNPEYLKKFKIDILYNTSDTCIYTTPVNIVFWEPKDLSLIPFTVVSIMLVLLVIGLIIWSATIKSQETELKNRLRGYQNIGMSKPQYENMVEEKEVEMVPQSNNIV